MRQIVARQPAAQAVEARKQDTLVDVRLIEFVPDLPLERRRHDNPPAQLRMLPEPVAHSRSRTGHQREEGELIDDAPVDRRRFHEHQKRVPGERIELAQRAKGAEQFDREGLRSFLFENPLQAPRKPFVRLHEVHAPHRAVRVEVGRIFGCEMKRDQRGIRPVEKASGEPPMLRQRHPVPHRIGMGPLRVCILAKVAQECHLEPPGRGSTGREPRQGAG
jgi:hypothetical protein